MHYNLCTFLREKARDCGADSAGTTSYQSYLVLQIHRHLPLGNRECNEERNDGDQLERLSYPRQS